MSGNLAKLNRALLVALCKNAETANTVADRIEELERENSALRHSEENLAATVRGLEFELEKAEKAKAMLRGTVEALGDGNDRLTIEVTGLRKDKERLDWLEKHRCFPGDYPEYDVGIFVSEKYGLLGVARAIDAARANGAK